MILRTVCIACILGCLAAIASAQPGICEGQGSAAMLVKGRCVAGYPLKFKVSGRPDAKFDVYMDLGRGPTTYEGVGVFCLDFSDGWRTIHSGRLSPEGRATFYWNLPDDPDAIGRQVCLQMAVEDDSAPQGVAISNGICMDVCSECPGSDPCEGGIRRPGFLVAIPAEIVEPTLVQAHVYRKSNEEDAVGYHDMLFDPKAPMSSSSSVDGAMSILSVKHVAGDVVVHALVDATAYGQEGRLPRQTTLCVRVGEIEVVRRIHASCSTSIGVGSYYSPFAITYMEDVGGE